MNQQKSQKTANINLLFLIKKIPISFLKVKIQGNNKYGFPVLAIQGFGLYSSTAVIRGIKLPAWVPTMSIFINSI